MQANQQCPPQPSSTNATPNLIFSQRVEANALSPVPAAPTPAGEGPFTFQSQATVPMRWPLHRRARSELAFRIPEDFDLCSGDPMVNGNFEEIVSEDDLFSTFMDIEKIGCKMEGSGSGSEGGMCRDWEAEISGAGDERKINNARDGVAATTTKPKHRHSNSMDGSSMSSSAVARGEGMFGEVLEAKKAMTAEQLAELAAIDPKRAKRIRSKKRVKWRSLPSQAVSFRCWSCLKCRNFVFDRKGTSSEEAEEGDRSRGGMEATTGGVGISAREEEATVEFGYGSREGLRMEIGFLG